MKTIPSSAGQMLDYGLRAIGLFFFCLAPLEASYIQVYNATNNGGLAFTGNTLGLDKVTNQNNGGTQGSIGAFISPNFALHQGDFPVDPASVNGTTTYWSSNGSFAYLDLPPGSVVLHAELIWAGSYGYDAPITLALINGTSVNFTTHLGAYTIPPKLATAQSVAVDSTGSGVPNGGFYVRSADVTTQVAAAVAAFVAASPNSNYSEIYSTGNVPGTVNPAENNLNCAGWTLAVAYSNPNMFTSNLSIYVACEEVESGKATSTAPITGFQAPNFGTISARLFCSALESDAAISGDQFLFGIGTANPPTFALSGSNNPQGNFFASQINTQLSFSTDVESGKLIATGSGTLDTRGSFGSYNSDAFDASNIVANRQGWDITSIDISNVINHSQTEAYAEARTTSDTYTVTSLGLQIQVSSPVITALKSASPTTIGIGGTVTFTNTFENIGETPATSLVFIDILPSGLTLVPGSVTAQYNGGIVTPVSDDIATGVDLSSVVSSFSPGPPSDTLVVEFQATATGPGINSSYQNIATLDYVFTPFSTPIPLSTQTNEVTVLETILPPAPVANPDSYTMVAGSVLQPDGTSGILANDTGTDGLSVYSYTVTAHGYPLLVNPDGSFVYQPPYNVSGLHLDSFNYTITDASLQTSAPATVTITITPVANPDSGTVGAGTTLISSPDSVLDNDLGTGLVVTAVSGSSTNGTYQIFADGTYIYTPAAHFSGLDTFPYTVTDSSGQITGSIVTIDVLPKAENDYGTTPANTPLNGSTVFANDPSSGTLISYTQPAHGGVVVNPDGTYTYTPDADYSGLDPYTYTVQDSGGRTTTATVYLTVLPLAYFDEGTTHTNEPLNQLVSVLDTDVGTGLVAVPLTNVGTVAGGHVTMLADGTYVYTPPANFTGHDSFPYTLTDQNASPSSATVYIDVLPQAVNDTAITTMNTTLVETTSILVNDQPNTLTVIAFTAQTAQGGLVSVNANGTYTYIPPTNFVGTDTFEYTAENSVGHTTAATVTITINAGVTSPPVNFIGSICECEFLNKTIYTLVATWSESGSSSITLYRIYKDGQVVAVIPAGMPMIYKTFSSKKCSMNNYTVTAVNFLGIESVSVPMQIRKCL